MGIKGVKIKVSYTDIVNKKLQRYKIEFENIIDYTTWIIFNEHKKPWLTIESVDLSITLKEENKDDE